MRRGWMLLLLAAVGCGDLPGKPDPAARFRDPNKIVDFAALFGKHCVGCHGTTGELGPGPPLNDPIFLAIVSDEELGRTIAKGRKGTSMPAFAKSNGGTLTEEQVVALVKGLREKWQDVKVAKKDWPPYRSNSEGDAERGRGVFARACAGCHGKNGIGSDVAGKINDRAFLTLCSDRLLRRIVITGRADLGMPNCNDGEGRPLSSRDVDDVVAYLMSWLAATR